MSNRLNHPAFLDMRGDPIANGLLRFYEPYPSVGATVTTFSDPDCQIPQTSPVIANQAGEFPTIYFKTTGPFRMVLSDYNGNVVSDRGEIFPLVTAEGAPAPTELRGWEAMAEFDAFPECQKCGRETSTMHFLGRVLATDPPDRLLCTCECCGCTWYMKTKDAKP